jgi:hypothetical protein
VGEVAVEADRNTDSRQHVADGKNRQSMKESGHGARLVTSQGVRLPLQAAPQGLVANRATS